MNLSTSNSKDILSIIMSMVVVFACTEIAFRGMVIPRSDVNRRIQIVETSANSPRKNQTNVVVFGNSFTVRGIDEKQVEDSPLKYHADCHFSVHALLGSGICEWYWLAKLNYLNPGNAPDFIVLNVGPTTLENRDIIRHRRLALIFGPNKLPLIPLNDLRKNKKCIEFLISRFLMSVNRGRNVGEEIFSRIIPYFQSEKQHLASREQIKTLVEPVGQHDQQDELSVFKRFKADCDSNNVRLVVVFMPHKKYYEINDNLKNYIVESSIGFIDHREIKGLSPEEFADGVHMTEKGKSIYSPIYVEDLIKAVLPTVPSDLE